MKDTPVTAIDPDALDVEWLEHANTTLEACEALADARYERDMVKVTLDEFRADMDEQLRSRMEKPTDTAVRRARERDPIHRKWVHALVKAERRVGRMEAFVKALDRRCTALENLSRLHGTQYFAGPSAPRDLGAEHKGMGEVMRNRVREKIRREIQVKKPVGKQRSRRTR